MLIKQFSENSEFVCFGEFKYTSPDQYAICYFCRKCTFILKYFLSSCVYMRFLLRVRNTRRILISLSHGWCLQLRLNMFLCSLSCNAFLELGLIQFYRIPLYQHFNTPIFNIQTFKLLWLLSQYFQTFSTHILKLLFVMLLILLAHEPIHIEWCALRHHITWTISYVLMFG